MNAIVQWLVVGALLLWSAWAMLGRLAPVTAGRLRESVASALAAHGHDQLAARLRTAPVSSGCDSGCGTCKTGCATPVAPVASSRPEPSRPVQWRP